jgi:recombination protein RecA
LDASTSLREEALRSAVGQIQTRFGAAALRQAAARVDSSGEVVEACPTGVVEIDELTGVGGIPAGRISLCLGMAGSGKMLIGYRFLAEASRSGVAVAMLDLHGHADPWLMAQLGVRLDRTLVLRPRGAVEAELKIALESALGLVRAGVGALLVDLPAGAGQSRLWDPFAATLSAACAKAAIPLLLLGEVFGEPLRYAASLVLRLQRQEWLLRHGDIDGVRLTVGVEKNKLAMPGRDAEVSLPYPRGTFISPLPPGGLAPEADDIAPPRLRVLPA